MEQAVLALHGCKREDKVRDRSTTMFSVLIHGSISDFPAAHLLDFGTPPSPALDASYLYLGLPVVRQLAPALGSQKAALD